MNNEEFALADTIHVIDEILAGGGEFRLYPKGTSMLPLIVQKRDSVVLSRKQGIPADRYDIAFYRRRDGQFVLHRVMRIEKDGSYTMCGDNQTALEKHIEAEQIIGYVSALYRKDRRLELHSIRYRAYVRLWCLMPIRRCYFLARRVCGKFKRLLFKK